MSATVETSLLQARRLVAAGDYEAAQQYYLGVLRADPSHAPALIELGAIAKAGGYRSAALTVFSQAIRVQPDNPIAHTGLASLLYDLGDLLGADRHYKAALAADPAFAIAHQGLARTLTALGDPTADGHWQAGFAGHAVMQQPYLGPGTGIPLLMLVAARGGNLHTNLWIDNHVFAVTAVYADFYDPTQPLPYHVLALNAIGDADLCGLALANAQRIAAANRLPVLNDPVRVQRTTRLENTCRLASVPGVVTPRMIVLPRAQVARAACLGFPLLLRSPGFHTGQFFVRVETEAELGAAAAGLPGEELLAIAYLDARGMDGINRKYRVMFIDGAMYPLHLAIAADWKVHYFSAEMANNAAFRAEEQRFLTDMPATLGGRAMIGLAGIQAALGLDYGGIDFALAPDGSVLLFEANATMVIAHADRAPIWDYRRPAIGTALGAARRMLERRLPA